MKLGAITFLVASLSLLNGCSAYHDVGNATETYETAHPSFSSFSEMNFEPVRVGESKSFGLESSSPTFEFPQSGKSYFKAYELPVVSGPATLSVRSSSFQNGYPSKGFAVFFPAVTLLSSDKRPVAELAWPQGHRELMRSQGLGTAYVELVAQMSSYPAARYAVVHTNAAYIGAKQRLHYQVPVPSPVVGVLLELTGGRDATFDVIGAPDSPSGNLEVDFDQKH